MKKTTWILPIFALSLVLSSCGPKSQETTATTQAATETPTTVAETEAETQSELDMVEGFYTIYAVEEDGKAVAASEITEDNITIELKEDGSAVSTRGDEVTEYTWYKKGGSGNAYKLTNDMSDMDFLFEKGIIKMGDSTTAVYLIKDGADISGLKLYSKDEVFGAEPDYTVQEFFEVPENAAELQALVDEVMADGDEIFSNFEIVTEGNTITYRYYFNLDDEDLTPELQEALEADLEESTSTNIDDFTAWTGIHNITLSSEYYSKSGECWYSYGLSKSRNF